MATRFYDIASKLDELREIQNPSRKEVDKLRQLAITEQLIQYFFHDLNNPGWVEPLYSTNWFVTAPAPKEDEGQTGFFTLPSWYQGEYLARFASSFPNIVRDVAISLETDNAHAIRTMLEAISKIPAEMAAQTVGSFDRWTKTPFAGSMMLAHETGLVMEHLAKGGQIDAAIRVLRILVELRPIKDRFTEGKIIAGTLHDLYWLNDVFTHNLPFLINVEPIEVVKVLEARLIEAIDLEVDPHIPRENYPAFSYWRLNIRPDLGREQPRDFKDLLVNMLISSLEEGCKQNRADVKDILSKYLDSSYVIFKRIAVYLLRIRGNQYPDLVEKAYRTWKEKNWAAGSDEFEHFLDAQFGVLSSQTQIEILNEIYRYMAEDEFADWAKQAVEQNPDSFVGNSMEEKETSFAEEYEFRQLHRFAQWLSGDIKKRYEELSTKYKAPPPRPESGVIITSWETEQSPVKIEELSKKTVHEVIQYLVDFVPESEGFRRPSREGLAQVFKAEVKNRLEQFVENSSLLIRSDLPFVYHENYLRGLEDAVKAGQQRRIAPVLELCEFILNVKEDKFEKSKYEPGLPHAKLAVANLLEQFLRTKEPYVENDMLDRIGQLILNLVHEKDDPFQETEVDEQNVSEIDHRTLSTNLDAATLSLNCIRGVAMHCVISYAFYFEGKRKAEGGDKDNPVMVQLAKDVLTEKLDKTQDPSRAVHAVIGWYFPYLMHLDHAWAVANLRRIFPLDQELLQYWIAAWSAYVQFSDVYTNVFPHLIDQYKAAIELLSHEKPQAFDRIDERLAEHLLKAYLMAVIDIDSGDKLLKSYYEKASDEVRSRGNFWLSQVLNTQKPDSKNEVWTRMWELWQWRVAEASRANDKGRYRKEIVSFSRLLDNTPVELDILYPVLSQAIEFQGEEHFEFIDAIEYLSKNAEKHIKHAVELLLKILRGKLVPYVTSDNRSNIRQILEQVKNSNDTEAKQQAVEIVNMLGERGDYEWRVFLADLE